MGQLTPPTPNEREFQDHAHDQDRKPIACIAIPIALTIFIAGWLAGAGSMAFIIAAKFNN